MNRRAIKTVVITVVLVAIAGIAAPYLPLDFLKPQVERALARGLHRRVQVDGVSLTLFSGPGLSLSGLTIHEDPRAGIEPFLYAGTAEARVDFAGLLGGRRGFSSLRLTDATLNLVKSGPGAWNFQMLGDALGAGSAAQNSVAQAAEPMPAIHVRGGRVNFKYGQTKSVIYFDDADLDVARRTDASFDVNFSGIPMRTDRPAESFSHVFVQGSTRPSEKGPQLSLKVTMEPAPLEGFAHLLNQPSATVQGNLALEAQITGMPSRLAVTGTLQMDDGHGGNFLTSSSGRWQTEFKGSLDAIGQVLELSSGPQESLRMRLCGSDIFELPRWDAAIEVRDATLGPMVDAARKFGAGLPEKLAAGGSVTGALNYSSDEGASGSLDVKDASLSLPGTRPVRSEAVHVAVSRSAISMSPAIVMAAENDAGGESARVQAVYRFEASGDAPKGADVKITTPGIPLDQLQSFGITDVPLAGKISQGSLRGSLRYRAGAWSGDYELRNAQVAVEGLASPVMLASASVSASGERVAVTKIRASAGEAKFEGEYRWEPQSPRPHQFRLQVDEGDPQDLEKLFQPTIARGGGLLARTLRLGAAAPVPEWLGKRRAEGTISIPEIDVGDHTLREASARVVWDGADLRLTNIAAEIDGSAVSGQAAVDLAGAAPRYWMLGKMQGVPYSGGTVDFEGRVETAGLGLALLTGLRAEGTFKGRSIAFSSDAEFRSVSGRFVLNITDGAPRWKFTGLDIAQGSDTYAGEGGTQADGKIVLDLTSRGRQVRYTGSLVALAPRP